MLTRTENKHGISVVSGAGFGRTCSGSLHHLPEPTQTVSRGGCIRRLFERIVRQCMEKGLVEGGILLTDSTHVKANASYKKNIKVLAERETTDYMERLDLYEAQERVRLETSGAIKAQRKGRTKKEERKVERTVSTTDPDAGMMRRPGKPGGMHYLSHQSLDAAYGIVVDVAVTPGKGNDSEPDIPRGSERLPLLPDAQPMC